jgi:predicted RNA-binding Zn-ribbon protein involved in translation (DUF1610 family)
MSEERKRIALTCSNCGRVLGTLPAGESVDVALLCPNCGAIVNPPGIVERLTGEVKKAINRITGKQTKKSSD